MYIQLEFVKAIPASWSKRDREEAMQGRKECTVKPDIDNMVKAVLDGLNGVAWHDDKQVVSLVALKRYGSRDCVRITLYDDSEAL